MCQPKPGKRCVNYFRGRYAAAAQNLAELEATAGSHSAEIASAKARLDGWKKRLDQRVLEVEVHNTPVSELEEAITARTSSEEYMGMLTKRDETATALRTAKDALAAATAANQENDTPETWQSVVEATNAHREAWIEAKLAHYEVEQYKDNTAQYAAKLAEHTQFPGGELQGDRLGEVEKIGEFEPSDPRWLELRQTGIGGSDMAGVLRLDPKYGNKNYFAVLDSKVKSISPEEFAAQMDANTSFTGALGRGNAWEPVIANRFAAENPDLTLLHTKATFQHPEKRWQVVNVDGVLSSDGVNPDGILEIKTASDASKWENGVPVGYRAQVLNYLNATGFRYAHVAVMIDDHDYRSFRIDADEPIVEGTVSTVINRRRFTMESPSFQDVVDEGVLDAFQANVEQKRNNPSTTSSRAPQKLFFTDQEKANQFVALHTGMDENAAQERLEARSEDTLHERVRGELADMNPSERNFRIASLDLETSTFSPESGEIIEIGVVVHDANGNEVDRYQEVFSVDERAAKFNGTGQEDVHHISLADTQAGRPFKSAEVQDRLKEILTPDTRILVHNQRFEKTWLGIESPWIREQGNLYLDTMDNSKYLSHSNDNTDRNTSQNTLQSYVESYGVPYEGAHRAEVDAEMTITAYERWLKETTASNQE